MHVTNGVLELASTTPESHLLNYQEFCGWLAAELSHHFVSFLAANWRKWQEGDNQ